MLLAHPNSRVALTTAYGLCAHIHDVRALAKRNNKILRWATVGGHSQGAECATQARTPALSEPLFYFPNHTQKKRLKANTRVMCVHRPYVRYVPVRAPFRGGMFSSVSARSARIFAHSLISLVAVAVVVVVVVRFVTCDSQAARKQHADWRVCVYALQRS